MGQKRGKLIWLIKSLSFYSPFLSDKICLCAGRRDLRVPGEHCAQDEQAAGAPGGGAQGRLTPVMTIMLSSTLCSGEDIRGPRHLRQGAQLSAAGVRHQRHHREPQVRGVGAQWGVGAGDFCDQGPGLSLHLQLDPSYRASDEIPSWELLLSSRQSPPSHGLSPRPQQGR